jgi:hypothetical protein
MWCRLLDGAVLGDGTAMREGALLDVLGVARVCGSSITTSLKSKVPP